MQELATAPRLTLEQLQALRWDDLAPARPRRREDVEREEGFFESWDGTKLFWQSWSAPAAPARGQVTLIHGYGEHSSRYDHVAALLARAGYAVMAMDVRGHGRSAGPAAHVDRYDDYVRDVERLMLHQRKRWGKTRGPRFVLGHSNGGLIALRLALRRPEDVAGFVITSPLCGLTVKIPAWKERAGLILSRLRPTFGLPSDLHAEDLSHDAHVVEVYKRDPLNRTLATARWFTETTQAFHDLHERAELIRQPLLMLVAGTDRLVDAIQSQRVFERVGSQDRELGVYPDLYHELLNELSWDEIATRIVLWMEQRRPEEAATPSDPQTDPPPQAEQPQEEQPPAPSQEAHDAPEQDPAQEQDPALAPEPYTSQAASEAQDEPEPQPEPQPETSGDDEEP